ncbi:MAG: hypothetical protein JNK45_26845 [Myxococcales bacterium]|nr:hypothetical protein [Myxococcales bacterium]
MWIALVSAACVESDSADPTAEEAGGEGGEGSEDSEDPEDSDDPEDGDEFRDISNAYRNTPVRLQNTLTNRCLYVNLAFGPWPYEYGCNDADELQLFQFNTVSYSGGSGWTYELCLVTDPTYCLQEYRLNGVLLFDPAPASDYATRRVGVQMNESGAYIQFRTGSRCVTGGTVWNPSFASNCVWTWGNSNQRYRLLPGAL